VVADRLLAGPAMAVATRGHGTLRHPIESDLELPNARIGDVNSRVDTISLKDRSSPDSQPSSVTPSFGEVLLFLRTFPFIRSGDERSGF